MKWKAILCGALLTVATASPAFAVVSGQLNLDGGSNQVTVGLTTIDWNPLGGGSGGFVVGGGTNVTCAGCPIPIGSAGTIKDLPPVPVTDFMTFAMVSSLHYDLSTIGPGAANTNCATANACRRSRARRHAAELELVRPVHGADSEYDSGNDSDVFRLHTGDGNRWVLESSWGDYQHLFGVVHRYSYRNSNSRAGDPDAPRPRPGGRGDPRSSPSSVSSSDFERFPGGTRWCAAFFFCTKRASPFVSVLA
jgi:hypothetical protein